MTLTLLSASWQDFLWRCGAGPDSVHAYVAVGTALFLIGVFTVLSRRNVFGVLMGVELILNGAALNFVALAVFPVKGAVAQALEGQTVTLFIIVLAAAEAAVALALALAIFRTRRTVDMTQIDTLQG